MSELPILELELETVELLPAREALKKRGKRRGARTTIAAAVAVGGDGGNGGAGGDTTVVIDQDAKAEADGKYAEAKATNVALVNIEDSSNGGNGGAGGDADASAKN